MNFNINDFFKFFWSIYKVALILFLSGISLILSNNEIREAMFLKDFITTYGVYIGFITIVSGIILVVFIIEKVINYIKYKYTISKSKIKIMKSLKDLSIEEKAVLGDFLINKTQTSNLGIEFESIQESKSIKALIAKGYVEKGYVGRTPHYYINSFIWDVLQDKWQEIFMKKNLWKITNE